MNYMDKELKKKIITVQGLTPKTSKTKEGRECKTITVEDSESKKYKLYTTKIDGTDSAAFLAIKSGKVNLYQKVGIAFNEEEKIWQKSASEQIKYMDRRVAFFFPAEPVDDGSQPNAEDPLDNIPF